jgi:protein TonB
MSATTEGGTLAAPSGNTLHGDMPKRAPDPEEVAPYRADHYLPPTQVQRLPTVETCDVPKSEYPAAAYRAGVEGRVRLRVLVGADGRVLQAKVVDEPGYGLGPAAAEGVRRHCRFRPAQGPEGPAATWITYSIRFEID